MSLCLILVLGAIVTQAVTGLLIASLSQYDTHHTFMRDELRLFISVSLSVTKVKAKIVFMDFTICD